MERAHVITTEPEAPTTSFAEHVVQGPQELEAAASGTAQKLELFARGAPIGWLGQNSDQCCVVTSQDAAVPLEPYLYGGVLHYRSADDTSRYLSVSDVQTTWASTAGSAH